MVYFYRFGDSWSFYYFREVRYFPEEQSALFTTLLQVAGGVILFLIALKMIFPSEGGSVFGSDKMHGEPFIVPIAIPLIAGPSAMATVLLMSTREPARMLEWIGALTICMLVTTVVFLFSGRLQKLLGEQAITALERLMGLVLTAISIEMLLGGVASYIRQFH